MKHYFYPILLLLFSTSLKAQICCDDGKIVMLHPSVGYTITAEAKKEFSLFPQYSDANFGTAQLVKYNDSTFTFLFKTKQGDRIEVSTTIANLSAMYSNIELTAPASSAMKTFFNPKTVRQQQYQPIDESENPDLITTATKKRREQNIECGFSPQFGVVVARVVVYTLYIALEVLSKSACKIK